MLYIDREVAQIRLRRIDLSIQTFRVIKNQGKFLQVMAQAAGAKNILEVGTLGGYSTIFLANALSGTKVTTIEYNHVHAEVCRKNFAMAGLGPDRVELHEGSGRDIVPKLYDEFRAGKRPQIDFAFIDADKRSNYLYFHYAVKMARTGAVIIVDNVVRGGAIASEQEDPHGLVAGSRNAIEKVGADPRVASTVVQTVGDKAYDGMIVAIKL